MQYLNQVVRVGVTFDDSDGAATPQPIVLSTVRQFGSRLSHASHAWLHCCALPVKGLRLLGSPNSPLVSKTCDLRRVSLSILLSSAEDLRR